MAAPAAAQAHALGGQSDLICTANAIINGYFPFGAVTIADNVAEVLEANRVAMGLIGHGYIYAGHPISAAAVLACLKETERLQVQSNAVARGAELFARLSRIQKNYAVIGEVRDGHRLMCAFELVSNNEAKSTIDKPSIGTLHEETYRADMLALITGKNVILSPPLIVTHADFATILSSLDAELPAMAG